VRSRIALAALAAIVAAALYVATGAATSTGWVVERYYTHQTWDAFADLGSKGVGADDIDVYQQSLTTLDGKNAGVVNGYGMNLHAPYVYFHWTAFVARGTVTLQSAIDLKNPIQTFPIDGGTGSYAGARGTVTASNAGKHGTLVVVRYKT
jgi:hypothetical protein